MKIMFLQSLNGSNKISNFFSKAKDLEVLGSKPASRNLGVTSLQMMPHQRSEKKRGIWYTKKPSNERLEVKGMVIRVYN